jgi:hypothetical protein
MKLGCLIVRKLSWDCSNHNDDDCYCLFTAAGEAIPAVSSSNRYIAQDFMCNGTEFSLIECSYSNATEECYGQHVAGFRCTQSEFECQFMH